MRRCFASPEVGKRIVVETGRLEGIHMALDLGSFLIIVVMTL
jgi:hypothetical protein